MTPPAARADADWPADDIHIDRLALRVTGLDEDAARELAYLVAAGLTPGMLRAAGDAGLGSLRVTATAEPADQNQPDRLARRIVSELGRVLARDRASGGPDGEVVP
jgi:hypothetical protein